MQASLAHALSQATVCLRYLTGGLGEGLGEGGLG